MQASAVGVYLRMIKIEHSVFALPFALLGMLWAAQGWPGWWTFGWIVVAMVSCRSAAMAYNRIVDRDVDALNPRTSMRALPAGLLRLGHANLFLWLGAAIFVLAAAMLNPLALALSPVALGVTFFYSHTKRFTRWSHFVLGASLGIAPSAAWVAVVGAIPPVALALTGAVLLWTAGFDILYALQDDDFDREHGLHSLPSAIGRPRAILTSRLCHFFAVGLLALAGWFYGAGFVYFIGVAVVAGMLAYEQSLVRADDLSRLDTAFFTVNGFVSIGLFVFAWIDFVLRRG